MSRSSRKMPSAARKRGRSKVPGLCRYRGVRVAPDHQVGAHRRGPSTGAATRRLPDAPGPPAPGARARLGRHEQLDPFLTQLAGAVQMSQKGQVLVLGQVDEMLGRKIRLPGLLVKGHPQEPEKDQGQEADRAPLATRRGPKRPRGQASPPATRPPAGAGPRPGPRSPPSGPGSPAPGAGPPAGPPGRGQSGAAPGDRRLTFPGSLPVRKKACRTIHGQRLVKINLPILHRIILFDK